MAKMIWNKKERDMLNQRGSWCVECGPNVGVDEDGCCAACGSSAMGPHANSALALRATLEQLLVAPGGSVQLSVRWAAKIRAALSCASVGLLDHDCSTKEGT